MLDYIKSQLMAGCIYKGRGGHFKYEIKGYRLTQDLLGRLRPYLFVKASAADVILALEPRKQGKRHAERVVLTRRTPSVLQSAAV